MDPFDYDSLESPREVYAYAFGNVTAILAWDRPVEEKIAALERVIAQCNHALERLKERETE